MRIRRGMTWVGVWLVPWLATGCADLAEPPFGALVVTVDRDSPPVVANGASVTLVGTPMSAFTGASGKTAFTLPAGGYQVRAALINYCPAAVMATVTQGATTNVTVSLGASACTSGSDQVSTGGAEALYGLVDFRVGQASDPAPCTNDLVVEGAAGVADLMANALTLTATGVSCHGAAWVFTVDHAPWFDNTATTFPWTNALGDVLTTTLPVDRLRVPVTIWMSDFVDKATYLAKVTGLILPMANSFLATSRSGLRLTSSEAANSPPTIVDVGTLTGNGTSPPPYPVIGIGCQNTPSITATPLVYHKEQINVYVVEAINGPGGPSGVNCREYGAANVIFVDKNAGEVTLLHEIGHALGLIRPHWGHVDLIAGMYPDNLMQRYASIAGHLSLGQITRMHVDALSWINQTTGTGTVRSRQSTAPPLVTACSCPGDAPTDDCPRVSTDIPRTGSPNAGGLNPACHITTSAPCVSLPPGGTSVVTAFGWTDATATTSGGGTGVVASLSPTLLAVTKPTVNGEGPGFVKAEMKAGSSPGITGALLSIGGNVIKVPVRIGSACP